MIKRTRLFKVTLEDGQAVEIQYNKPASLSAIRIARALEATGKSIQGALETGGVEEFALAEESHAELAELIGQSVITISVDGELDKSPVAELLLSSSDDVLLPLAIHIAQGAKPVTLGE